MQETRLLHAVHFSKGCYLGQEIVERVRSRGAVHKGMALLNIDSAPPEAGAVVFSGEAKAGQILSAVFSPLEQQTVAFAMMGVEYLVGEKPLRVQDATASLRASSAFGPA